MSSVYTVKSVGAEPREWSSSHGGTFVSYTIDLEQDGVVERGVEWARKPESKAPAAGEVVAGHVEEGRFGPKFKMDYEATKELSSGSRPSGGSSAPSGGSTKPKSGNWQPESERDPERAARILRQHSQEMAVRVVAAMGLFTGLGPASPLKDWALAEDWLKRWADFFDRDAIDKGQAANQGAGAASPSPSSSQGASPATTPAPDSRSAPSEDVHDVEMALSEPPAGSFLSPQARTVVATYMLSELPPEELLRACNQLTNSADQSQQDQTLRAMKLRAERWTGKPLPEAAPADEEIPF